MSATTTSNGHGSGPGRLVPVDAPIASEDAERGVLGALLLHNDPRMTLRLLNRVELAPDCFYWETHGQIFAALVALARAQIGGDEITINAEMERRGTASSSARELLRVLPSYVPAAGNYVEYGEHVVELARWRERRRVAQEMLAAVDRRNESSWREAAATFLPSPEEDLYSETPDGPRTLRLVDETGSVVGEQVHCDSCEALKDQLKGAETDIRSWRTRYANLKREKEENARSSGMWQDGQRLFEYWKKKTGRKKPPFTADRYLECEPYLRNAKYGFSAIERAIAGLAFDPFITMRKNGSEKKHNDWELLFRSAGKFEEYWNRAPVPWESELQRPTRATTETSNTSLLDKAVS